MTAAFPVFRAGDEEWSSAAITTMAEFLGLALPLRQTLSMELATTSYAEEEGFEVTEEELQEASDAFRYRYDLLTTDDTETWLQGMGVIVDDLNDYITRKHWAERFHENLAAIERDYAPDTEAMESTFWPEVVFDGALRTWAAESAKRAAAWIESGRAPVAPERRLAARQSFIQRTKVKPRALNAWLQRVGLDETSFERHLDMQGCFEDTVARIASDSKLGDRLQGNRQAFTRIVMEQASFPSSESASEAALCVREDKESLAAVAGRAGVEVFVQTAFLDDLPDAIRRLCLSAAPGEVLGPIERAGRFELTQLREKRDPDPDDAEVRRRLEKDAVDSTINRLVDKHVVWLVDLEREA